MTVPATWARRSAGFQRQTPSRGSLDFGVIVPGCETPDFCSGSASGRQVVDPPNVPVRRRISVSPDDFTGGQPASAVRTTWWPKARAWLRSCRSVVGPRRRCRPSTVESCPQSRLPRRAVCGGDALCESRVAYLSCGRCAPPCLRPSRSGTILRCGSGESGCWRQSRPTVCGVS